MAKIANTTSSASYYELPDNYIYISHLDDGLKF